MNNVDIMTEIAAIFENKTLLQKDVLGLLNLKNAKRAKKLWSILRKNNTINKAGRKFALAA